MTRVCFYHAGCPDGFGAAWSAWTAWGEAGQYRAIGHHDPLEAASCRDADVVFADIVPSNDNLEAVSAVAGSLVVLDHHWSAQRRLEADYRVADRLTQRGHRIHFDLDHSGAVLSWKFFHPDEPVPELLRYVEDMDLWRFALPHSAEVNAAINSYPRSFPVWERLRSEGIEALRAQGTPLVRAQHTEIERLLHTTHRAEIAGSAIEAVNATAHRSRVGHEIAKRSRYGRRYGLVYRIRDDRVLATLYSIGEEDVSELAARYGGGGHRNAAGFQVSLERWRVEFLAADRAR